MSEFQPIQLEEMKDVELMNRIDTKFVFHRTILNQILPSLASGYRSLDVNGTRMSAYNNQYFDTNAYRFYLEHHNGKNLRYKVRIRKYEESDLYFLEVKKKWKGRTDKKRIKIDGFEPIFEMGSKTFVETVMEQDIDLETKLYNSFDRITLVSKEDKERLTIDVNLSYTRDEKKLGFNNMVIAELKQEGKNTRSLFYKLMKENIIRPGGFSKYCIGALSLNEQLKYNNFKPKLLLMNKLR